MVLEDYTWPDSKWRHVPVKRDSCLIPNLVGTYLCGAKNWKKVCYRILNCREMGVEALEVTITWTILAWRSFTCVRPRSWINLTANWLVLNFVDFVSLTTTKIWKCAVFWIQVTDYELLWGLSRVSGHFAPWSFRPHQKSLRSILEVTSPHTRVTLFHTEITFAKYFHLFSLRSQWKWQPVRFNMAVSYRWLPK